MVVAAVGEDGAESISVSSHSDCGLVGAAFSFDVEAVFSSSSEPCSELEREAAGECGTTCLSAGALLMSRRIPSSGAAEATSSSLVVGALTCRMHVDSSSSNSRFCCCWLFRSALSCEAIRFVTRSSFDNREILASRDAMDWDAMESCFAWRPRRRCIMRRTAVRGLPRRCHSCSEAHSLFSPP